MLSTEQFQSILTDPASQPLPGGENVRRVARVGCNCRMRISHIGSDSRATNLVQVQDISPRGARFVYHRHLPRGTTFIAQLSRRDRSILGVLCTVAHSQPAEEGMYSIGAEFTCVAGEPPQAPTDPQEAEVLRIRRKILGE